MNTKEKTNIRNEKNSPMSVSHETKITSVARANANQLARGQNSNERRDQYYSKLR